MAKGPTTLTLTTFGYSAEQLEGYQNVIVAFEKKFPNIKIQTINVPSVPNYREKLLTMFASGSPPDVMMMSDDGFREFASKGLFMDLDSWLANESTFKKSDFFESTFQAFEYNGKTYGIPRRANNMVMFYNQTMFDRAGIAYPSEEWTWDDFLAAAKKLSGGQGPNRTYGVVFETFWIRAFPWIWQAGGSLLSDDYTKVVVDSRETIDAIQFLQDLIFKHEVAPPLSVTGDLGTLEMFQTGRVGMVPTGAWKIPNYRTVKDFTWDVAHLPKKVTKASPIYSSAYCIAKGSKNPEEAWEFVKYMSSEDAQIVDAAVPTALPTLKSVAFSPTWLEPDKMPKNRRIFLDALEYGRVMPLIERWNEMGAIVQREFDLLWAGVKNAEEVAKTLKVELQNIVE
jgi:multiple sugar transport system substrate-binding protein